MSADLKSALELLLLNDYASLVVATAVGYDYILTFPREVEYVWEKPWSFVSTAFVIIRYTGLCWIMTSALVCTSFIPGPLETYVSKFGISLCVSDGSAMFLISFWMFAIFLSAADSVMILRVYAMWNRSPRILCVLLSLYVLQVITTFAYILTFNSFGAHFSVRVTQILDISSCDASFIDVPPMHNMIALAPRFALGGALIILAVVQTVRQSFLMYKMTKQWQINRYMHQLAKDGVLYFFVYMLYQIACVLNQGGTPPPNTFSLVLNVCAYVLFYPLVPRFIISVRALYDRDRHAYDHEGIDTGFGVLSRQGDDDDSDDGRAGSRAGLGAIIVSTVVFADDETVRQSPGVGGYDVDVSSLEGIMDDLGQV